MAKIKLKKKKKKEEIAEFVERIRNRQAEILYKELAVVRHLLDKGLANISHIDSSDNLAEAAFKAGRGFDSLDQANDKLERILEDMQLSNEFEHYDEIIADLNDN